MLEQFLKLILPNFILVASMILIWHKLANEKLNIKSIKIYITLFIVMFFSIFNFILVNKFIRIILITIIFMFVYRFLFKKSIRKCIMTPIFYQIIIMISETIVIFFTTLVVSDNILNYINSYLGIYITNISVSVLSIFLVNFKFVHNIYNYILKVIDKIKINRLATFGIFVIIALSIFPMTIYYKVRFEYLLLFYSTMIIACFIIVIYLLRTEDKYYSVSNKYNVAINSLTDYESMMNKYRIANHENKNLLLTIRAMILNKEKDIPKYIDTIIENKYEDDERLLFKMNVIPTGGLRATIYSEILKIKEKNIKYELIIDKKLSAIDIIELDERTIIDICKIIGVFIDNAIEEVQLLRKKLINIDIYVDNDSINIRVSNNYKGNINIEKIFESGYTTKSEGHGFGLSMVKKIVENNRLLENITEIKKNLFSQVLIIKYKNKKITNIR